MRTTDSVIPPAAASDETATAQIVLAFEDNKLASVLFGQYGQNLALIERRLGVVAEQRGNHVTVEGSRGAEVRRRRRGVAQLGSALRSGRRGRRFKSGHPDPGHRPLPHAGSGLLLCIQPRSTATPTSQAVSRAT